ncbi:MAG: hypothetical protein Q4G40_06195 [Brachybacterium sp.]|nr:hypothetical protein [Brachybacterium sp.]
MNDLLPLAWRWVLGLLIAGGLILLGDALGIRLNPVYPIVLALAGATLLWLLRSGVERAHSADVPRRNDDPEYASPDASDVRVRRLEDMVFSAQPSRRISQRALGQLLGHLADEALARRDRAAGRTADRSAEDRTELPEELRTLIRLSRTPDSTVSPITRRELHAHLRLIDAIDTASPTRKETAS